MPNRGGHVLANHQIVGPRRSTNDGHDAWERLPPLALLTDWLVDCVLHRREMPAELDRAVASRFASLPGPERRAVDAVLSRLVFDSPAPDPRGVSTIVLEPLVVRTCVAAFVEARRLVLVHAADADLGLVIRRVEPHGLLVRCPRWHVVVREEGRAIRSIPLDCIVEAHPILHGIFRPGRPRELLSRDR